jgi:hypothetical protein
MAGRGHELDAKSTGIEDDIAKRIRFDLAAIAASGANLTQSQGSPQQLLQTAAERVDGQRTITGYDKILAC